MRQDQHLARAEASPQPVLCYTFYEHASCQHTSVDLKPESHSDQMCLVDLHFSGDDASRSLASRMMTWSDA